MQPTGPFIAFLCLKVLTMHRIELSLFLTKAFPLNWPFLSGIYINFSTKNRALSMDGNGLPGSKLAPPLLPELPPNWSPPNVWSGVQISPPPVLWSSITMGGDCVVVVVVVWGMRWGVEGILRDGLPPNGYCSKSSSSK